MADEIEGEVIPSIGRAVVRMSLAPTVRWLTPEPHDGLLI
jgi:hypothetical protein